MPSNTKSKAARIPCGKCGGYVEEKRRLPGLSPDSRLTAYFFSTLLLPRMVASGLAACFMNADGHIVFNPTATDIWVENKGEIMTIKAGETVSV